MGGEEDGLKKDREEKKEEKDDVRNTDDNKVESNEKITVENLVTPASSVVKNG